MSLITARRAVERLKSGLPVALPTETVYGLAARMDSEPAILQIFATKQRPFFDPLIVHVTGAQQARELCAEWPALYDTLTAFFWPGPLTLVAKKNHRVSDTITSGLETVALRSPRHPLFRQILEEVGVPLAAPSANRFGQTSPTTAQHVESEFNGAVEVVDGGACAIGLESTVLSAQQAGRHWQLKILRPGGVSRADLSQYLRSQGVEFTLTREESTASPGHLKAHYQPLSPVILLCEKTWSPEICAQVQRHLPQKISGASELRLPENPQAAARVLYGELRRLSLGTNHVLWIQRRHSQNGEDWEVIWDRVERAASLIL